MNDKRQHDKELQAKYETIARCQTLKADGTGCTLVINRANVHIMQDGGAWVDAQIWVPKEAIE